jgi:hypothetical protein
MIRAIKTMTKALKQKVMVKPGGWIEVQSPELLPGASAEVIVLVEESHPMRPLSSWLGAAPGCYASPQDAVAFLRQERDQWDS